MFRYSAGLVDWTKTELEQISKLWIGAFKHAWTLPRSTDSTPLVLDLKEGGRECPSAVEVWILEVLDVLDQCVSLPGEISRLVTYHLQQLCVDHGCYALNQLQYLLRVGGVAESVFELLLLRLDEQGLSISSP